MKTRHRRSLIASALSALASALLAASAAAPATVRAAAPSGSAKPERPSIVFLLTDDMGLGDLGCYGGKLVPTPNIDRLASEGTRYLQYYSAAPICSPSRAGLITGMHQAHWRITSFLQARAGNAGCEMDDFLDPKAPSLPRALKAAGYATAHIGKWHLGGGRDVVNPPKFAAYGYDEGVGTYESPEPHPDITATDWIWSDKDKVKRWDRTAFFFDKTLDFLSRNKGKPTFVNLWIDDPHTPWVWEGAVDKKDSPRNLKPVLAELDKQVGRFMSELKRRGLDDNLLLVFVSDNGPLPSFKAERAAGLRGTKASLWEGGIRLPFIVRWPGRVPAGRVDEKSVVAAWDMFPTFCALAGASLPSGHALIGQDVSASLRGGTVVPQRPLFWEYGRNEEFFRYPNEGRSPSLAVRRGDWKLLVNPDGGKAELYNLASDRNETKNLAAAKPELTAELTKLVLDWRATWPKKRQ